MAKFSFVSFSRGNEDWWLIWYSKHCMAGSTGEQISSQKIKVRKAFKWTVPLRQTSTLAEQRLLGKGCCHLQQTQQALCAGNEFSTRQERERKSLRQIWTEVSKSCAITLHHMLLRLTGSQSKQLEGVTRLKERMGLKEVKLEESLYLAHWFT